jgi:CelD/BcsL family acetyltransferase involved in cellulose biosynthesis
MPALIPVSYSASPIEVHSSRDPARLTALQQEWSALFEAAGAPCPFLSWEWLHTWWRFFGQRRAIWILEARDGTGRLVGAVALATRPGLAGRRFQFLGNGIGGADGLDFLVRPEVAAAARAALAQELVQQSTTWDALDLEDLPYGSPTLAALRRACGTVAAQTSVERRFVCPGFALTGTYPDLVRGIRRRETFGRRRRWLERQPGFRIDVAPAAELDAAMQDFLRLHRLRWEVDGGSSGIPPGVCEDFHRALAPLLAERGWLRLYRLRVGGEAVAAVYGLELGRQFYFYQSGFDPAWSARSPGMVLLGRTIEDAFARELRYYDFLRGTEAYKFDWASDRRDTCALRVQAPGLRAEAAAVADGTFRAVRGLARSVTPDRIWDNLRRMKRGLMVNGFGGLAARRG